MANSDRSDDQTKLARRLIILFASGFILAAIPVSLAYGPAKKSQVPAKANDNPESQAFLARLRQRVLNNWLLPDGHNVVVIEATANPNGDVLEVKTDQSKADALAIEAATSAFENAKPLGNLPVKYHGDCKITLTFTSHVDPHGDSTSDLTSRIDQVNQNVQGGNAQQSSGGEAQSGQSSNQEGTAQK